MDACAGEMLQGYIGKWMMLKTVLAGKRKRGGLKGCFMDKVKMDMQEDSVTEEDAGNRS